MAPKVETIDFHYYFLSAILNVVVIGAAITSSPKWGQSKLKCANCPPFDWCNKSNHLQIEMKTEGEREMKLHINIAYTIHAFFQYIQCGILNSFQFMKINRTRKMQIFFNISIQIIFSTFNA